MAINLGNFGEQVASGGLSQGVRQPSITAGATEVAGQFIDQKQQLDDESMRARLANQAIDYQNQLQGIHQGVVDGMKEGSVKPEDATKTYNERAQEAIQAMLDGLDGHEQRVFAPVLKGYALRGTGQIAQAQSAYVQDGIHAQLSESLSGLDKLSVTDPDGSIKQARLLLDNQGPKAGLSQEQISNTFDHFASTTQYQNASLGIQSNAAIGQLKQQRRDLTNPETLPYLNAQHRTALMNQIDSRVRELDTQHRLNQAEAMGGAREIAAFYLQAADNGQTVSPDLQLAAQHAKETLGTTPAGKLIANRIDGAMAAYDQVSRLYGMSFAAQDAKTAELYTAVSKQTDPHQAAQLQQVADRVASASQKNRQIYEHDPFAYYEKITGNVVPPLDLGGDLSQQLASRSSVGAQLSGVTGVPTGLLRPSEAAQIKSQLDTMPVDRQLSTLSAIQQAAPVTAKYTMQQIGAQKPVYQAIGLLANDPSTKGAAALIARGNQLDGAGPNDKAIKLAPGFDNVLARQWNKDVGEFFQGNAQASSAAMSFTRAAYLALAERDGKNFLTDEGLDRKRWNEAVDIATGGVVKFNGYKTIPPYAMSEDVFNAKAGSALRTALAGQAVKTEADRVNMFNDSKLVIGKESGTYDAVYGNRVIATIRVEK